MLIKKAAQETGLTERAIRFYEEAGLIKPGQNASHFRDYSEEDLDRLLQITTLRGLNMSLDEITVFLNQPGQSRMLLETVYQRLQAKAARSQDGAVRLARVLQTAPATQDPANWIRMLVGSDAPPARQVPARPKHRYGGVANMRESRLSGIIWIAGLLAIITGVILAAISLLAGYKNNQAYPIGNAMLTLIVTVVPGLAAMALSEVLENQVALLRQSQRTHVALLEMTGDDLDESPEEKLRSQNWKCASCGSLNETDTLYCRHCQALRDRRTHP